MFVKKLSLKNFRNYETATFELEKHINIVVGNNAQGKTSLIEGIYALSTTKSHRTTKDVQMIRFKQDFAKVEATVEVPDEDVMTLSLSISKQGKKAKHNNVVATRLTAYIAKLKTVFFAPEDLELIKGSPSIRRKFLDMEIGQIDALYLHHLSDYRKILKQRNEWLKNGGESESSQLMLEVLTSQMLPHLIYLLKKRLWFLEVLESHAQEVHAFITDEKETISFQYENSFKLSDVTEEALLAKYEASYGTDKRMKTTTLGVHRDDFSVCLSEMSAHDFASQGQQRTAILSIKLAEIDLIQKETGFFPVLLLDDVLSELDESRQMKLLTCTENKTQTFITTTSITGISQEIVESSEVFVVEEAKISKGVGKCLNSE